MARRNRQPELGSPSHRPPKSSIGSTSATTTRLDSALPADELLFPGLGELARKVALGCVALLFVTRAYFPSEDADGGSGLVWVVLVLATSGIAVIGNLITGITRIRWSWVDAAVFALIVLVGLSAGHAADRRAAITMAWEWGALGLLYAMARNLPRTRAEVTALGFVVIATATAVAGYGLYQAGVEFPIIRRQFEGNPLSMLAEVGIAPNTPAAESFRKRLLDSNEPFSTFALANSLAGFIVGPLLILFAVGIDNLRRDEPGRPWWSLLLAAVPAFVLLVCLLLTKSRSAYIGCALGLMVLAWSFRSVVPRRWLIGAGIGLAALLGGLIAVGVANQQLDVQILTQARLSLSYRWEYWVGTWGIITDAPAPFATDPPASSLLGSSTAEPIARTSRPFWWGVGPGNFATHYLQHKLPAASEEVRDPHNAILEVWAESGVVAMLAMVVGWGLGLILILGRGDRRNPNATGSDLTSGAPIPGRLVPADAGWLVLMGGLGWFGVWALGELNPVIQKDMTARWLVLGGVWLATVLLIGPLLTRRSIPAAGMGAALLAMVVELQAAGGIGMPSVAMVLWMLLALGLNLRDDRPAGRIRVLHGLSPGVVLACGWAMIAGTFYGAVVPGWQSDRMLADGEAALAARPPRYEVARNALAEAIRLDHYAVRPWLALADLEYRYWRSPEAGERHKNEWTKILLALDKAVEEGYRNPDNLAVRRRQASYARLILNNLPNDARPVELVDLKTTIAKATRQAVRLYPTSAPLRAELAQASADLGMYADAAHEARIALQLDDLMPHADKKLPAGLRTRLEHDLVTWDDQAKTAAKPTTVGR